MVQVKNFQRPRRLELDEDQMTPTYGKFVAQPFERGFGTTIGNALRRTLLSSVEGAAITAVKFDGVLHEFTSIPGIVEDVSDIILNLKTIPLKMHTHETKRIEIDAEGPCTVTAKDIVTDPDVEILEKDIHLATLGEKAKLHVEMIVNMNRGYVVSEMNYSDDFEIGFIPLDSNHSPIRMVNYEVGNARVGQSANFDKLSLEIHNPKPTNSTGSK